MHKLLFKDFLQLKRHDWWLIHCTMYGKRIHNDVKNVSFACSKILHKIAKLLLAETSYNFFISTVVSLRDLNCRAMPLYPTAVLGGPQLPQPSPKLAPPALMLNMSSS